MSPQVSNAQKYASGSDQSGGDPAAWLAQSSKRCTQSQQSLDAQIAQMVGRSSQSAAQEEAAATGSIALALMQAGWTVERVAAELVRRQVSMSAEFLKDEQPKLTAAKKKKKKRKKQEWWAQQQNKRTRQQQRGEKKRLLAIEDGEEKADEERWHEMSCAFVDGGVHSRTNDDVSNGDREVWIEQLDVRRIECLQCSMSP